MRFFPLRSLSFLLHPTTQGLLLGNSFCRALNADSKNGRNGDCESENSGQIELLNHAKPDDNGHHEVESPHKLCEIELEDFHLFHGVFFWFIGKMRDIGELWNDVCQDGG
jgi:hypothetical protein